MRTDRQVDNVGVALGLEHSDHGRPTLSSAVGALHRIKNQRLAECAACSLALGVSAEPVVGEAGVGGAVLQAVLHCIDLDTCT